MPLGRQRNKSDPKQLFLLTVCKPETRLLQQRFKLLVLLLSFVLFTAACGGSDDNKTEEGKSAKDTVPKEEVPTGGEITYASDQEPTGWNPQTGNDSLAALAYLTTMVYPQAFITQPDFSVEPDENLLVSAEQTKDDPQTIEFKINLLAPARGPHFRFEGTVVKPGRTISVVDGRALQLEADGSGEKLIATMSATVMTVRGREALKH